MRACAVLLEPIAPYLKYSFAIDNLLTACRPKYLSYTLQAATLGNLEAKQKIAIAFQNGWRFTNVSLNEIAQNLLGFAQEKENNYSDINIKSTKSDYSVSALSEQKLLPKNKLYSQNLPKKTKSTKVSKNPPQHVAPKTTIRSYTTNYVEFFHSFIIRFALLGCIGLIFALCKKVYLFYNLADVIISSIVSLVLFLLCNGLYESNGNNESFVTYSIIAIILIITLIPYSLQANPGSLWSFILVVPAKAIIGCLGILALFGSVGKIKDAIKNKKERGTNFITAIVLVFLSYKIYKLMMKTTKYK